MAILDASEDEGPQNPNRANNEELKALNATMVKVLERLNSIDNHLFQLNGWMKFKGQ